MLSLQAFRFALEPTGEQVRNMRRFAGGCRVVWNKALAKQQEIHAAGGKFVNYVGMAKWLTEWRQGADLPWLKETPVHAQQQTLKALELAYKSFFDGRMDAPRFKAHHAPKSFRYPDPKQFTVDSANGRVKLPKLGWVQYRKSRDVLGTPKNITVSETAGRWFVSIQTEREVPEPSHPSTSSIGVDVGIARFAALSDGAVIDGPKALARHARRMARLQRNVARKVEAAKKVPKPEGGRRPQSKRLQRERAKVARLHAKIANTRKDAAHKASTTLADAHRLIVVEALNLRAMTRSAAGTADAPGTNVAAKSGLNRAMLDQGFGQFRTMLAWKLQRRGGELLAVDPRYTSQTCPECGCVSAENRRTQALFRCVDCGHEANADTNAARNILARGHEVLSGERKQIEKKKPIPRTVQGMEKRLAEERTKPLPEEPAARMAALAEQIKLAEALTAARLRKTNARKGTAAGHAVAAHGGQGDTRPVKCEPAEVIRPGGNAPPDAVGIPVL